MAIDSEKPTAQFNIYPSLKQQIRNWKERKLPQPNMGITKILIVISDKRLNIFPKTRSKVRTRHSLVMFTLITTIHTMNNQNHHAE